MSGYRKWVVGLGLIIGVLLEVTIIPTFGFCVAELHLLLLFALYFGYRLGPEYGFGLGLAAGYLKDIFSIGVIGANAFSFSLCGLMLAKLSTRFYQEWFLSKFISVFFMSLLYSLIYYLFTSLFINLPGFLSTFKEFSLKPALLTAFIASPLFAVLDNTFKYSSRFYQRNIVLPPIKSIHNFR